MAGHYDRLANLDTSFLALETSTTHMHVAALMVFDAGPMKTAEGGVDSDRIRRFIDSRLHLMPRYRQRLAFVPFEQAPVWVDDEHFSIDYHVRHTSLPRPGGHGELVALMGRLASQPLDRAKPLWEVWIVEGLSDDRFAIISKTHHAMIDGISGVDLMQVLLNLMPVSTIEEGPPFTPRPVPGGTELVVRETARRVGAAASAMRSVRRLNEDARAILMGGVRRVRAIRHSLASGWLSMASDTPLNGKVGPNRRFATLEIPLDQVKAVKNALGGSVNDVVLATVAGAVRRYLDGHGAAVDDVDFRVMAPVSVRSKDQRGTLGNQVAMWIASLPVSEPDPVQRLLAVQKETEQLKATDQALGAATLVRLSAGAPLTVVSLASRLAANARPFNMTVTNVPGPQFPLYLLEARLTATYPLVPLWEGHGAGIALFSYAGTLYWGFNADWDVVADVDSLKEAVRAAFEELHDVAAQGGAAPEPAPRRRKKLPPMGAAAAALPAAAEQPATAQRATAKKPGAAKKPAGAKTPATAQRATARKPAGAKTPATAQRATARKPAGAKKPATAQRATARKPAAASKTAAAPKKAAAAKKTTARKPAAAKKPAAASKTAAAPKKTAAAKPSAARKTTATAKKPAAAKKPTPRKPATPRKTAAAKKATPAKRSTPRKPSTGS